MIDNIQKRLEYFKNNGIKVNAHLEYQASTTSIENGNISVYEFGNSKIYSGDEELLNKSGITYGFVNETWKDLLFDNLTIDLSNGGYLVEIWYIYSEITAPLAAFTSGHYQWVVLDNELNPLLIILGCHHHTIS